MNSAKLQDTKSTYKNQLCLYTQAMNNQKRKLRKPQLQSHKRRIKYLGKTCTLKTTKSC